MNEKIKQDFRGGMQMVALALMMVIAGCVSGPVELLQTLESLEVDCTTGARCAEEGMKAVDRGRDEEAMAYFHQGCERGEVLACRRLGDGFARGDAGVVDLEVARGLYGWSCLQGEGSSCHSLGELERLSAGQGAAPQARAAFRRACELGEVAGCHDLAVVLLRENGDDGEAAQKAVQVFGDSCEAGLSTGCTNLAFMQASARGTVRDHRRALKTFQAQCEAHSAWVDHPLASLARGGGEPDIFTVSEYDGRAPCRQLEVLAVGSFEERVNAAFDAEQAALRACYEEIRVDGMEQVGQIVVEAEVSADGGGRGLEILADSLGEEVVQACVRGAMERHLVDASGGVSRFRSRWSISFIHRPVVEVEVEGADGDSDIPAGCDPEEVRRAVGEAHPRILACGRRHLEEMEGGPGLVMARWRFEPDGAVGVVNMSSTIEEEETLNCLEDALRQMKVTSFQVGQCPVEAPFVFSDGAQLHFAVILR